MKKGAPPSTLGSTSRAGGRRKASTSAAHANCGTRVSSLVDTRTVRASAGSACMTSRRVVALAQSLQSSRHSKMYSRCSILDRTMASTARALACASACLRPGAALSKPGVSMMVKLGQNLYSILNTISLAQKAPSRSRRVFSASM